jgi:hypothetical protein
MKMIYKFPVPLMQSFTVDMPGDAVILSLQEQAGEIFMWAMFNLLALETPVQTRTFVIAFTGRPFEDNGFGLKFVGTFQQAPFVFHLFEVIK